MMVKIFKSDNLKTRHAKKSFRRTVKRGKTGRTRRHRKKLEKIKRDAQEVKIVKQKKYDFSRNVYSENVELFCSVNKLSSWKYASSYINLSSEFSLFENPKLVLKSLLTMLFHAKKNKDSVTLNYKDHFAFGALYFIDQICWEIAKMRRWNLRLKKVPTKDLEILQNLKSINAGERETSYAYIVNSPIRINRSDSKLASQNHKEKSTEVRRLIERGISETQGSKFEMPLLMHTAIDSAISEHFDNILLHVPNADFGFLCSIFDKHRKEVTIVIYNFGKTIADSLSETTLPIEVRRQLDRVIESHTKKGFLGTESKFSKENALTLLAIQEGISSQLNYDISRGHGIMDYIEHTKELCPNAKIVVISGNTAIRIDENNKIELKDVLDRKRRIIALNSSNDIFEKPDSRYVMDMDVRFPGVIIETTIQLNQINSSGFSERTSNTN